MEQQLCDRRSLNPERCGRENDAVAEDYEGNSVRTCTRGDGGSGMTQREDSAGPGGSGPRSAGGALDEAEYRAVELRSTKSTSGSLTCEIAS